MPSCERCWSLAQDRGISYEEQLRIAEQFAEPCTLPGIEARRLIAGQFWNEDRQIDTRYELLPGHAAPPETTERPND